MRSIFILLVLFAASCAGNANSISSSSPPSEPPYLAQLRNFEDLRRAEGEAECGTLFETGSAHFSACMEAREMVLRQQVEQLTHYFRNQEEFLRASSCRNPLTGEIGLCSGA